MANNRLVPDKSPQLVCMPSVPFGSHLVSLNTTDTYRSSTSLTSGSGPIMCLKLSSSTSSSQVNWTGVVALSGQSWPTIIYFGHGLALHAGQSRVQTQTYQTIPWWCGAFLGCWRVSSTFLESSFMILPEPRWSCSSSGKTTGLGQSTNPCWAPANMDSLGRWAAISTTGP